jgi:hypothetical protein
MMDDLQIFDFERDFAGSLRCIPMIVRFKLDQCGVKLSLRQWSQLCQRPGPRPPCLSIWARWTPLQRFALFKLTRAGHDNDNFGPALVEFLADSPTPH